MFQTEFGLSCSKQRTLPAGCQAAATENPGRVRLQPGAAHRRGEDSRAGQTRLYIERAEPVVFVGKCGAGKAHLATDLCVATCRQKRRVSRT